MQHFYTNLCLITISKVVDFRLLVQNCGTSFRKILENSIQSVVSNLIWKHTYLVNSSLINRVYTMVNTFTKFISVNNSSAACRLRLTRRLHFIGCSSASSRSSLHFVDCLSTSSRSSLHFVSCSSTSSAHRLRFIGCSLTSSHSSLAFHQLLVGFISLIACISSATRRLHLTHRLHFIGYLSTSSR